MNDGFNLVASEQRIFDTLEGLLSSYERRYVGASFLTLDGFHYIRVPDDADEYHLVRDDGVKLRLADLRVIDSRELTSAGEGMDASGPLQAALNAFRDEIRGDMAECRQTVLKITGNYTVSKPLLLEFNEISVGRGLIDMSNGRITADLPGGTLFRVRANALVRNLRFQNLNLRKGASGVDVLLELDGGDQRRQAALYRWQMDAPQLTGGKVPLWIRNNCFEGSITDPNIQPSSHAEGFYGILFDDHDDRVLPDDPNRETVRGNVSSIVLRGGTIAGGQHNIYERSPADLRAIGTTFLEAGQEAFRSDQQHSGGLFFCHFENAWHRYDGPETLRPVITQHGHVMVEGCDYRQNRGTASVFINTYLGNNARSTAQTISLPQSSIDYFHIGNTSDNGGRLYAPANARGKMQYAAPRIGARLVSLPQAAFMMVLETDAKTAPVIPDLRSADNYLIHATGPVRIADPAFAHPGDHLTLVVENMSDKDIPLSWPAGFAVQGSIWLRPGKLLTTHMLYTGQRWIAAGPGD